MARFCIALVVRVRFSAPTPTEDATKGGPGGTPGAHGRRPGNGVVAPPYCLKPVPIKPLPDRNSLALTPNGRPPRPSEPEAGAEGGDAEGEISAESGDLDAHFQGRFCGLCGAGSELFRPRGTATHPPAGWRTDNSRTAANERNPGVERAVWTFASVARKYE